MAKLDKLTINVDRFITDTRIISCCNRDCKNIKIDANNCNFKEISISEKGVCNDKEIKNDF